MGKNNIQSNLDIKEVDTRETSIGEKKITGPIYLFIRSLQEIPGNKRKNNPAP